tara:strand:- start:689 stop:973 length:285 start_codon:yes stop_codon:yes gene_type:complete
MGRLTIQEVEQMKKSGVLTDEAVKDMQDKGLVGSRKRGTRRFLKKTGLNNGTKVYPQLYFSGFGKGNKYTNDMKELRNKFSKLIKPYTKTEGEK